MPPRRMVGLHRTSHMRSFPSQAFVAHVQLVVVAPPDHLPDSPGWQTTVTSETLQSFPNHCRSAARLDTTGKAKGGKEGPACRSFLSHVPTGSSCCQYPDHTEVARLTTAARLGGLGCWFSDAT